MNTVESGRFIKERLKLKGYTQDDLAEYLSISKQAVSQNLSGRSTFEISNLMMIAEFLDVTVDQILYAGEKRETLLSKYYNQNIDSYKVDDVPAQPDSMGKTLLDYCIDDDNLDKFNWFYENRLIIEDLKTNLRFFAFLIRVEALKIFKSSVASTIKDEEGNIIDYNYDLIKLPSLQDQRLTYEHLIKGPIYPNLQNLEKEYVDAILECKNEEILRMVPDLVVRRNYTRDIPKLVLMAIEKDIVFILKFYIDLNKIAVTQTYFDICIKYNANECAKYLYDNYNLKSIENLIKINDRDFIQGRIESMKFNQSQMSKGLITAIEANDLLTVKSLVKIVDQNTLNLALEHIDFLESMDIGKVLLDAGAVFSIVNAYNTSQRIELNSMTSIIKYLMMKQDEKQ